jgi:exodeoxyribonuclease V beta subunit
MSVQPLDIRTATLDGVHLIEASAGTGKTYNIVSLYLRMLADPNGNASVENILVVTFTEAATTELKHRLRGRLSEVVEQLSLGNGRDELVQNVLSSNPVEVSRTRQKWEQALRSFDLAEIHTIHGLCRRVLEQHALLAGVSGKAKILADTRELFEEIARRFLASEVYEAPAWFSRLVGDLATPSVLVEVIRDTALLAQLETTSPHPLVLPAPASRNDAGHAEIRRCFEEARRTWTEQRERVLELLRTASGLNGRSYGGAKLESLFESLEKYFDSSEPLAALDDGKLALVSAGSFRMNKGHVEPSHPLFWQMAALRQALDGFAATERRLFLRRLVAFSAQALEASKRADGLMTFDDLVVRLSRALRGELGEELAQALRSRYQAALVDEFQDTDSQQYDIFRRIFARAGWSLFLIGDPKQSIYGFRGADVHAYLDACRQAAHMHTLNVNRRSTPALVRATSAVFSRIERPFGNSGISFELVSPAKEPDTSDGAAALEIHYLSRREFARSSGKLSQRDVLEISIDMTAEQIARGNASHDGRTAAVLVRRNRDVEAVQQALRIRGIAATGLVDSSVLATDEARDLCTVFAALLEPSDLTKVRSAMLTPLLGYCAQQLVDMEQEEARWRELSDQLAQAAQRWELGGALSALRCLLEQRHNGRSRAECLLERQKGLDALLHYEHVAELMALSSSQNRAPISAQWRWLSEGLGGGDKDEAAALRLSGDPSPVRVMTVHKSKGLEFDEVYCPCLWWAKKSAVEKVVVFHDAENAGSRRAWIMPESSHPAVRQAQLDQFEEELRLIYVALTRAKHRCVVFDAVFDARLRALSWLLHARTDAVDPFEAMKEISSREDDALLEDLRSLSTTPVQQEDLAKPIEIHVPTRSEWEATPRTAAFGKTENGPPTLQARPMAPVRARKTSVHSFTSMCSGHTERWDSFAHKAVFGESDSPASKVGELPRTPLYLVDFDKGPNAGDMLHKVLEGISFGRLDKGDLERRTLEALLAHGFDADKWIEPVSHGLWDILAAPLAAEFPGLSLATLSPGNALAELEFLLPIDEDSLGLSEFWPERLSRVFAQHGHASYAGSLLELTPFALRGYLRGFVDLVFEYDGRYFFLDYKSNYLGHEPESYAPGSLGRQMEHHHYVLQYHLYGLALKRYLSLRIPNFSWEQRFGGVFYLFLRGISPRHPAFSGVFRDRPGSAMLEALATALGVKEKGEGP